MYPISCVPALLAEPVPGDQTHPCIVDNCGSCIAPLSSQRFIRLGCADPSGVLLRRFNDFHEAVKNRHGEEALEQTLTFLTSYTEIGAQGPVHEYRGAVK